MSIQKVFIKKIYPGQCVLLGNIVFEKSKMELFSILKFFFVSEMFFFWETLNYIV